MAHVEHYICDWCGVDVGEERKRVAMDTHNYAYDLCEDCARKFHDLMQTLKQASMTTYKGKLTLQLSPGITYVY